MYFSMLLYFEGEVRAGTAGGADINVSCRRRGTGGGGGGKGKGGAEEVSNRARSSAWHKQMD